MVEETWFDEISAVVYPKTLVFGILVEYVVPVVEDTVFEDKSFGNILEICLLETSLMPVVEDISFEETIPVGAIFFVFLF